MTVDLSTDGPINQAEVSENPRYHEPRNRCQAHKKNGARCKRPAIPGGTICRHHGGNAPHVRAAAQARLEKATDRAARELIDMSNDYALDYKRPDVRLAAIKDVLDRGGIKPADRIEVGIDAKPFEKLLMKGIARGPRDESRRVRSERAESSEETNEPLDAEVVSETGTEEPKSGFQRLARKKSPEA